MDKTLSSFKLKISVFLLGFTTIGFQIIFFREQMSLFQGNELTLSSILACWLIWGSIGSLSFKFWSKHTQPSILSFIYLLMGISIFPTLIACRYIGMIHHFAPGEIASVGTMFINSFLILGPFCFLGGSAYAGAAAVSRSTSLHDKGPAWIYTWEAIGGVAAACLQRLFFKGSLPPIESILYLIIAIFAASALFSRFKIKLALYAVSCLLIVFSLSSIPQKIERYTESIRWSEFNLLDIRETPYGRLILLDNDEELSLLLNGTLIAHSNDPQTAEETVHLPLSFHPEPDHVLILGGGFSGIVKEVLKHPVKRITIVYLDATPIRLIGHYPELAPSLFDSRVSIVYSDIRDFVISDTRLKYDVILDRSPEPLSIGAARFYSYQYFREIRKILAPDGIYALRLRSAENFLNENQRRFLKCALCTVQHAFPDGSVKIFPGSTADIIVSPSKRLDNYTATSIIQSLESRHIQSYYVGPGMLPFRLAPFKVDMFLKELNSCPCIISEDLNPKIFTSSIRLWKNQFEGFNILNIKFSAKFLLFAVFLGGLCLVISKYLVKISELFFLSLSIGSIGFSELACEILLVFLLQLTSGAAYLKTGILLGVFATGLALGGYTSYRFFRSSLTSSRSIGIVSIIFSFVVIIIILPFKMNVFVPEYIIDIFALSAGYLGGVHFSLSSRLKPHHAGRFYGIDLMGSSLGAICVALFFLPNISIDATFYFIAILSFFPGVTLLIPAKIKGEQ